MVARFLTYPALQKGGAWWLRSLERGRFTPWACRDGYRLRPCVPGCVALWVQRPKGATLGPDPRLSAGGRGCSDSASLAGASDGGGSGSPRWLPWRLEGRRARGVYGGGQAARGRAP